MCQTLYVVGAPKKLLPLFSAIKRLSAQRSQLGQGVSLDWPCQGQVGGPLKPQFSSEGHAVWDVALVSKATAVGPPGQVFLLLSQVHKPLPLTSISILPPCFHFPMLYVPVMPKLPE